MSKVLSGRTLTVPGPHMCMVEWSEQQTENLRIGLIPIVSYMYKCQANFLFYAASTLPALMDTRLKQNWHELLIICM